MNSTDFINSSVEEFVGIRGYITSTKGCGGTIKKDFEDFFVEELINLNLSDEGEFLIIKVKKKNWDTLNFVRVLAKKLKISQKRVEYAGTKDKRAVSIQYFSIYKLNKEQIEKLRNLKIKDVEIEIIGKSKNRISLGDLLGNWFKIKVSEIENESEIEKTYDELKEKGAPNFFGLQRFGTMRFITHLVGLHILKRDYENAFWTYVAMPTSFEGDNINKIRKEIWETREPTIGLREYPPYLRYERLLLQALREGKNEEKALLILPKNLKMMFIHAYQSYIFNKILSKRIEEFGNLREIRTDDYSGFFKPATVKNVEVQVVYDDYSKVEWRFNRIKFLISSKRGGLALPIPGYETDYSGWAGKLALEMLSEDELRPEDFRHEYKEFTSRGGYRLAEIPFSSFKFKNSIFEFTLPKGCYATVLLREFTKTCLM